MASRQKGRQQWNLGEVPPTLRRSVLTYLLQHRTSRTKVFAEQKLRWRAENTFRPQATTFYSACAHQPVSVVLGEEEQRALHVAFYKAKLDLVHQEAEAAQHQLLDATAAMHTAFNSYFDAVFSTAAEHNASTLIAPTLDQLKAKTTLAISQAVQQTNDILTTAYTRWVQFQEHRLVRLNTLSQSTGPPALADQVAELQRAVHQLQLHAQTAPKNKPGASTGDGVPRARSRSQRRRPAELPRWGRRRRSTAPGGIATAPTPPSVRGRSSGRSKASRSPSVGSRSSRGRSSSRPRHGPSNPSGPRDRAYPPRGRGQSRGHPRPPLGRSRGNGRQSRPQWT